MSRQVTSVTPKTVVLVIATAVILRRAWRNSPKWIKKRGSAEDGESCVDLASPAVIWSKMKEMIQLSYEKSEDLIPDDMPWYKLYACFMSMVHLHNEIDILYPDYKDNQFKAEGEELKLDEVEALCKYVNFAKWAYEDSLLELRDKLRPLNYLLIRHDTAIEPGRVGHFIAVHHESKEVVLSIKGTSTFSDLLTDIIGKAIPHKLCDKSIRCHEGMWAAANLMLEDTLHMITNLFIPTNYKLTVCGHSLGAGVSSLLGIFLKDHLPELDLQVYAFATPACASFQASLDCQSYITSVVNNTDCVPRMSLLNLRMLHKVFMKIDSKLDEKGLSPDSFKAASTYFKDLLKYDDNLLMEPDEISKFMSTEIDKDEHNQEELQSIELFVPGRVVSLWESYAHPSVIGGRAMHGGMKVLRQLFIETTMLRDHACDAYRDSLTTLLKLTKDGTSPI